MEKISLSFGLELFGEIIEIDYCQTGEEERAAHEIQLHFSGAFHTWSVSLCLILTGNEFSVSIALAGCKQDGN